MRISRMLAVTGVVALIAAMPPAQGDAVQVEIAIGKAVTDRMPVDTASAFPADVGTLYCWTRVTGVAAGSKLSHVWTHGPHSVSIDVNVGGSPWRTFTHRTIPGDWTGEWKVEVRDSAGTVLATKSFTVGS